MAPCLFEPVGIGTVALQQHVVLAPPTRCKAIAKHIPYLPLVAEYYAQRAIRPGTLLITESTLIAARAGGPSNVLGIWDLAQIGTWREVWTT